MNATKTLKNLLPSLAFSNMYRASEMSGSLNYNSNTFLDCSRFIVEETVSISGNRSLDLTNHPNLTDLGLSLPQIVDHQNYITTQVIGDIARRNGFDGILFRSTHGTNRTNLVVFGD